MNAKQWISLMCYVVFEETTHKRRLGSKSFFYFNMMELMMEICLQETMEKHQSNSYSTDSINFFDSFQYLQCFCVGRRFSDLHQTLYFRR